MFVRESLKEWSTARRGIKKAFFLLVGQRRIAAFLNLFENLINLSLITFLAGIIFVIIATLTAFGICKFAFLCFL